jgi:anti-sigma regulatory factor (Ser/Thr protein kinase)
MMMPPTMRIAVKEQSQIAEARRVARKIAGDIGLDADRQEQVAIVVTEACTNIVKYAGGGEILVNTPRAEAGDAELEVLAIDRGPGMRNLARCLRDGYTTGSSPGHGLGTIVRLSADSDFYSEHGKGAALIAKWSSASANRAEQRILRIGAVNIPKPGQEVCGDSWGVVRDRDQLTLMVADGLGHGYEAQLASQAAVQVLYENPGLAPKALLEYAHGALRSTRGAAVAVARVDRGLRKVVFAGIGNVAAQICAGTKPCQHLVSVNGTVGHQSHQIREFSYAWPEDGIIVMYSDGLSTGTSFEGLPGLVLRDPGLMAGVLYRDFSRGHDDATVVVARAA